MKTIVAEIVSKIQEEGRTGLLSFTVFGNANLFKVFFSEGNIYHLACGSLKGPECLANIDAFDFSGYSFISSIKLDVNGGGLPSTGEIVTFLHAIGKTTVSGEGQAAPTRQELSPEESARIRDALRVALMKQIGPAGDRIFTRVLQGRSEQSAPFGREDFVEVIGLLKEEIDDGKDREDFLLEARGLLPQPERRTP